MAPSLLHDFLAEDRPILYQIICSHLDTLDIIHLSRVCRLTAHLPRSIWNINRHLSSWVYAPVAFRDMMAQCNAVVSGSDALQFLSREKFDDSDLDVYIERSDEILKFCDYLIESERYKFMPYEWQSKDLQTAIFLTGAFARQQQNLAPLGLLNGNLQDFYELKSINNIIELRRVGHGEKRIQIIATSTLPTAAIIKDYHATHVFNFFTWNRCYSLFPSLTFGPRLGVITKSLNEKLRGCIQKYSKRGWSMVPYCFEEQVTSMYPIRGHRRIGDKYTWVINFNCKGLEHHQNTLSVDLIERYSFSNIGEENWRRVNIDCVPFVSPVLKYSYFCGDVSWTTFLGRRISLAAKMADFTFENPAGLIDFSQRFPSPKPEGFEYADEKILEWYKLWENTEAAKQAIDKICGVFFNS